MGGIPSEFEAVLFTHTQTREVCVWVCCVVVVTGGFVIKYCHVDDRLKRHKRTPAFLNVEKNLLVIRSIKCAKGACCRQTIMAPE